jgi:predicted transcriptional regulator
MRDKDHAMSIRMPDELYERIRKLAFDRRVSMSKLFRQALEDLMAKLESEAGQ